MSRQDVSHIATLVRTCISVASTIRELVLATISHAEGMIEMTRTVSDIKDYLDELRRLSIRIEDKFTRFLAEAPENATVREIAEISEPLEKLRIELENSSELLQTNQFWQQWNACDIREHLTEARIAANHCLDRIEAYPANPINPVDVIDDLDDLQKTLHPKQDDHTHQILERLNAASDAMNTLVTSPVESGNEDETLQITGQQDEPLEINANVSTDQVSQIPDPSEEMLDEKEDDSITKLQDLPAALQKIIDFIATSGLSDEETQELVLPINNFREAWSIDIRDIEFDKYFYGLPIYLGRGASGNVLAGNMSISIANSDEKKRFKVAIKEVHARASEYPTGEILREVLLQMSIRHDNILSTYGLCWMYHEAQENSRGLIVMERMSHNLKKAISSKFIFDVSEKVRVLRDVLEALVHLHENGIVHRDVKPENILLNIRDENIAGFAKLSDFGCSRKVSEETITRMTMMSSVPGGTLLYSPPEVIMNPKIRTRKSWDVYSFGLVMCYVFTGGKIPDFEVSEQSARSGALLENAHKWARKIDDTKYRNIALRCLHKDEKKRSTMKYIRKLMDGDAELIERNMNASGRWNGSVDQTWGKPLEGPIDWVHVVSVSPSGDMIVSASGNNTIRRWNSRTGEQIGGPLKGHTDWVNAIAISKSGEMIVSGSRDNTLRRWTRSTGEPIGEPLKGHTAPVWAVAISPSGTMIVSGSDDGTIRRWNSITGAPIGEPLKGNSNSVWVVEISPRGDMIVSGSDDGTIRRWNSSSGEQIGEPLRRHTDRVYAVAISPSGNMIVSASHDGTKRRWNASTDEQIGEPLKGHTDWLNALAFSTRRDMIVSASWDKTVRMWNSITGEKIGIPLRGHFHWVLVLASCTARETLR